MALKLPRGTAADAGHRRTAHARRAGALQLKNYEAAATILLDVVEKYPNSRAYPEALLLARRIALPGRDFYSSRRYFGGGGREEHRLEPYQEALQRLVELSLYTGDYDPVDGYLARLAEPAAGAKEPPMPYVRGKYYYFRRKLDDATQVFASIPQTNPYYFQARYFIATIQVAQGELARRDPGLRRPPEDAGAGPASKDVQDFPAGHRAHPLRALSVRQGHRVLPVDPAPVEVLPRRPARAAWTYIKAKEFQRAYRSLNLLLLADPDPPRARAADLKGNLHLRMTNFDVASETFTKARDEFEPIHGQLNQVIAVGDGSGVLRR